ncbi:MAG: hypothetical protein NZ556_07050, partial [Fimbriimonadales bacterium]|nr:hypothetical protein [Fimbriimonadales bacterium]
MTKSLIVIGAGGHAKVVISTARALGYSVETVYDDDSTKWGASLMGVSVRGNLQQIGQRSEPTAWSIIAVGDNRARQRIAGQLRHLQWATLIHPQSWIDPTAQVGAGTLVCAGVVVQPDARIGRHCIVNTAASVDHDCTIADFVHVAPGARLAGG